MSAITKIYARVIVWLARPILDALKEDMNEIVSDAVNQSKAVSL